jgi:hypothetical protein
MIPEDNTSTSNREAIIQSAIDTYLTYVSDDRKEDVRDTLEAHFKASGTEGATPDSALNEILSWEGTQLSSDTTMEFRAEAMKAVHDAAQSTYHTLITAPAYQEYAEGVSNHLEQQANQAAEEAAQAEAAAVQAAKTIMGDADGSGTITNEEALARFDLNKDGRITRSEMGDRMSDSNVAHVRGMPSIGGVRIFDDQNAANVDMFIEDVNKLKDSKDTQDQAKLKQLNDFFSWASTASEADKQAFGDNVNLARLLKAQNKGMSEEEAFNAAVNMSPEDRAKNLPIANFGASGGAMFGITGTPVYDRMDINGTPQQGHTSADYGRGPGASGNNGNHGALVGGAVAPAKPQGHTSADYGRGPGASGNNGNHGALVGGAVAPAKPQGHTSADYGRGPGASGNNGNHGALVGGAVAPAKPQGHTSADYGRGPGASGNNGNHGALVGGAVAPAKPQGHTSADYGRGPAAAAPAPPPNPDFDAALVSELNPTGSKQKDKDLKAFFAAVSTPKPISTGGHSGLASVATPKPVVSAQGHTSADYAPAKPKPTYGGVSHGGSSVYTPQKPPAYTAPSKPKGGGGGTARFM